MEVLRDHGKFNKYNSISRGVTKRDDESKKTWYITIYSNIFLLFSEEEAGALVSYRKSHAWTRVSAGNKIH